MESGGTTNSLFETGFEKNGQRSLIEAEHVLLELADYVYGHTSLKPISKTLFLISRCLFVAKLGNGRSSNANDLITKYKEICTSLNGTAPDDDFNFASVVSECSQHVPRVMEAINRVRTLTEKTDSLGLVFNTLLRGKFEGGEGMGTYLTPEEVVYPMVDLLFKVVDESMLDSVKSKSPLLFGDICGGTGRFVYALARRLEEKGHKPEQLERSARLFDQSSMAVDHGKLNFLFDGMKPSFERVGDSLIAPEVTALKGRFLFLATNPPFGAGKYQWNAELGKLLPYEVLSIVGMTHKGETADPAELFFFRNLDLLAPGGALSIVLPDGVVQSDAFKEAIIAYEKVRKTSLNVDAVVSLPSATFALGGTVAKTSFLVVQKQEKPKDKKLYVAVAHNVGFVKKAKKRSDDPKGNDLVRIAEEFGTKNVKTGCVVENWRKHESLVPARLMHASSDHFASARISLSSLVVMPRDYTDTKHDGVSKKFHVSILDVDTTGLIDVIMASKNQPVSKGLACRTGDILISCLNPNIWRVGVVPNIKGVWSCSPEFAVLRPKKVEDAWKIALAIHHPLVKSAVVSMGKGTSSSRQRVQKERLLLVTIPTLEVTEGLAEYVKFREYYYENRLREAGLYEAIHEGGLEFSW